MAAFNVRKYVYAVRTPQKSLQEGNLESTVAKKMEMGNMASALT